MPPGKAPEPISPGGAWLSKGRAVPGIVFAERILASPHGGGAEERGGEGMKSSEVALPGLPNGLPVIDHPKAKFGAGRRLPERG